MPRSARNRPDSPIARRTFGGNWGEVLGLEREQEGVELDRQGVGQPGLGLGGRDGVGTHRAPEGWAPRTSEAES